MNKNKNCRLFAFDRIITQYKDPESVLGIKICNTLSAGTEGFGDVDPDGNRPVAETVANRENFVGTEYMVKGLTADQARELLNGTAYLEFWALCMDHSKPTLNNRFYPLDKFVDAMNEAGIIRQMNFSNLGGEVEHPVLKNPTSDPRKNVEINMDNMSRLIKVYKDNVSHYITGFKVVGTKSYIRVKTSLNNRTIVKDILNGKLPCFSIRTTCEFAYENGVNVARHIKFITVDYVANPANVTSFALPDMRMMNAYDNNVIDFQLLPRTGTESVGDIMDAMGVPQGYKLSMPEMNYRNAMESLQCMILEPTRKAKETVSFERSMKLNNLSIL